MSSNLRKIIVTEFITLDGVPMVVIYSSMGAPPSKIAAIVMKLQLENCPNAFSQS
jgi:hypothetical protein